MDSKDTKGQEFTRAIGVQGHTCACQWDYWMLVTHFRKWWSQ